MRQLFGDLQAELRQGGKTRRPRARRPALEGLEERALLSAAPHWGVHGHEAVRHRERASGYQQTNLVSDLSSQGAQVVDTNLKNPWGVAFSAKGPLWVVNAGSSTATVYSVNPRTGGVTESSLVVTLPSGENATGQAFNPTTTAARPSFMIPGPNNTTVPAEFLFDTLQGTIDAWNPNSTGGPNNAVIVVDNSAAGNAYTGLAVAPSGGQYYLYAANGLKAGPGIDVYNSSFSKVTLKGSFVDPYLSSGFASTLKFAPDNLQYISGRLYVTYRSTLSFPSTAGAIAEFNTDGTFVRQIYSNDATGVLQNPWGMAMAPAHFGEFSHDLLVGNFYNGEINAFRPSDGKFLGTLSGPNKQPIVNPGLWAISFGNGGEAGSRSVLYVDAGINDLADGIFGALSPVTS
jgi:uncharacterized protein (TIGR03118 family)